MFLIGQNLGYGGGKQWRKSARDCAVSINFDSAESGD